MLFFVTIAPRNCGHWLGEGQGPESLRFLDARIFRSSVEKPDKDETAGGMRSAMGIVRLGFSQPRSLSASGASSVFLIPPRL